ncbi:hypothetical protein F4703DRAFT_1790717 [Phycomyces blakesleeanus]
MNSITYNAFYAALMLYRIIIPILLFISMMFLETSSLPSFFGVTRYVRSRPFMKRVAPTPSPKESSEGASFARAFCVAARWVSLGLFPALDDSLVSKDEKITKESSSALLSEGQESIVELPSIKYSSLVEEDVLQAVEFCVPSETGLRGYIPHLLSIQRMESVIFTRVFPVKCTVGTDGEADTVLCSSVSTDITEICRKLSTTLLFNLSRDGKFSEDQRKLRSYTRMLDAMSDEETSLSTCNDLQNTLVAVSQDHCESVVSVKDLSDAEPHISVNHCQYNEICNSKPVTYTDAVPEYNLASQPAGEYFSFEQYAIQASFWAGYECPTVVDTCPMVPALDFWTPPAFKETFVQPTLEEFGGSCGEYSTNEYLMSMEIEEDLGWCEPMELDNPMDIIDDAVMSNVPFGRKHLAITLEPVLVDSFQDVIQTVRMGSNMNVPLTRMSWRVAEDHVQFAAEKVVSRQPSQAKKTTKTPKSAKNSGLGVSESVVVKIPEAGFKAPFPVAGLNGKKPEAVSLPSTRGMADSTARPEPTPDIKSKPSKGLNSNRVNLKDPEDLLKYALMFKSALSGRRR